MSLSPEHLPPLAVRVTGGKFNGYEGTLLKRGDFLGSIQITFEGKPHEVITDLIHLTPLSEWQAQHPPAISV